MRNLKNHKHVLVHILTTLHTHKWIELKIQKHLRQFTLFSNIRGLFANHFLSFSLGLAQRVHNLLQFLTSIKNFGGKSAKVRPGKSVKHKINGMAKIWQDFGRVLVFHADFS